MQSFFVLKKQCTFAENQLTMEKQSYRLLFLAISIFVYFSCSNDKTTKKQNEKESTETTQESTSESYSDNSSGIKSYEENLRLNIKKNKIYIATEYLVSLNANGKPSGPKTKTSETIYDKNGRIVKITSYQPNGSIQFTQKFAYDKNGNKKEINAYQTDMETHFSKHSFEYDENNFLVNSELYMVSSQAIAQTIQYINDEKGLPEKIQMFMGEGKDILSAYSDITHDENGNLVKAVSKNAKDEISATTEAKYDKNNNKLEELSKDAEGKLISKSTFKYDKNNVLVERKNFAYDGTVQEVRLYEYQLW